MKSLAIIVVLLTLLDCWIFKLTENLSLIQLLKERWWIILLLIACTLILTTPKRKTAR